MFVSISKREAAAKRIAQRKLQWAVEARKREMAANRCEDSAIDRGLILFA